MHKLTLTTAALAALTLGSLLRADAEAAVGRSMDSAILALSQIEQAAGCYRLGETGYHWYRFCAGPYWLYPHHRYCRRGYCSYR